MIDRSEYLNFLISLKDKKIIKVITGIRRSGKSTMFKLYKDYLFNSGISDNQLISYNFDDPINNKYLDNWEELYKIILKSLDSKKMNYVFLDEIQLLNSFERLVNGLFLKDNVDIYVTGSNSYMLSGELATYLTGRYMQIHMLPLSFKEFFSTCNSSNELKEYQTYIENGGFPYTLSLNSDRTLINNYLEGIYNTVLMKDVVARNNIKDVMILDSVVRFVFDNIGQLVSTNKITNTLNSNNRKISVNTTESYLNSLLDSYIIYKVTRYDIKGKEHLKTGDKYYVCDLGLRNFLLGSVSNLGSILENIVYLELKRRGYEIFVGKNNTKEIDFVVKNTDGLKYIQVALSVRDTDTLERELSAFSNISDNYPKYLITLDYDTCDHNGIKQISAIDFLLGRVDI